MDAFAKSDDERDFYLDRAEGFPLFIRPLAQLALIGKMKDFYAGLLASISQEGLRVCETII